MWTPCIDCPVCRPCTAEQFTCVDGACISDTKVCDFRNDCSDKSDEASCPADFNFEVTCSAETCSENPLQDCSDLCGWNSTNSDMMDWSVSSVNVTAGTEHGPQVDASGKTSGVFIQCFLGDNCLCQVISYMSAPPWVKEPLLSCLQSTTSPRPTAPSPSW